MVVRTALLLTDSGIEAAVTAHLQYENAVSAWPKSDGVTQKVIVTIIAEKIMLLIINCGTTKEMWDKLTGIHERKSEASKHILQQRTPYENDERDCTC